MSRLETHHGPGGHPARRRLHPALAVATVVTVVVLAAGCTRGREPGASPATPGTIPGGGATTTPTTAPGSAGTAAAVPVKPAVTPTAKTVTGTLKTADGRDRTYHVYVPTSLPPHQPVPLLLALHGGTGWGQQFERNSGFDGLAEANQFIVVYPDGIEIGPAFPLGRVWNGGNCCGPAAEAKQDVDDVAFLSQLIDTIEREQDIDPHRVYAAGHSNGGIMSYRLACELSDKIVAIGLQAGWVAVDRCQPAQPVSLFHLHGTADDNAPIDGGRGTKSIAGVDARAADDSVRFLVDADGCPTPPAETVAGDLTTQLWSPCREGTAVQLVKVKGASHAWMGHGGVATRMVGQAYENLDASAEIWAFLATHPRR